MIQFIGRTGLIQKTLTHKLGLVRAAILRGEPVDVKARRLLFTGPPGVGKTELAKRLALDLAGHPLEVEKRNGQNVTIDVVRDWTAQGQYRPMWGDVSVKFVDEIDAVGAGALNDLRTYLDDLAPHRVFLACTNKPADQLQEQLQSRFQVWPFLPVPAEEIAAHLQVTHGLDPVKAREIGHAVRGNVRAAEEEALSFLDVQAALAVAA